MKPHYFIGVQMPIVIAEKLASIRDSWELQSHKRLTPAEDMHLTLLFIGEDVHEEIEQVKKQLAQIRQSVFTVTIDGVKTFGNPNTPRIIYASLLASQALNALHQQVHQAVEDLQIKPDTKKFVPHITLASKWAGKEPGVQQFAIDSISVEVSEFSLFRIAPREMPRYQKIANYQLEHPATLIKGECV